MRGLMTAALCLALATPAAAQQRWMTHLAGPEAAASYGTPESDDVWLSIECSGGSLIIDTRILLPRPTMRVSVAFAIDGDEILRPATTSPDRDEMDGGFPVYVRVRTSDPLVGALQRGGRVTLAPVPGVPGVPPHTVPLRGSANALDVVVARC